MEDVACNSTKADQQTTVTEQYNDQFWTKILKEYAKFSTWAHWEAFDIGERQDTWKKIDALKHKKGEYQLFKVGYASKIWVKWNIRKARGIPHFIVRSKVHAEMRKL